MGSPVSPIVVNLYMENLEQNIIVTAPENCQARGWMRYMDDIICLVHTGNAETLQQRMNTVDPTGSIVFTREDKNKQYALLGCQVHQKGRRKRDVQCVHKERKHTDQYLNFASDHLKHQKLWVVITPTNRCETITTEEEDKKEEIKHLRGALRVSGCPSSALRKIPDNAQEKKKTNCRTKNKDYRGQVVIPYVEGVQERVHRVMKKYGAATATRPHTTLRRSLVHPKDKVELAEQGELVYQIPRKNCGAEYIGETGRLLKTWLDEHRKDVDILDNTNNETYTRSGEKINV